MVEEQRNTALADEIEAINSIYGQETIRLSSDKFGDVEVILRLPSSPFSFKLAFESSYPDSQPFVKGVQSVAQGHAKGNGKIAEELLADTLQQVYTSGQVCLFDLIEEARQALGRSEQEAENDNPEDEAIPTTRTAAEQEEDILQPKDNTCPTMYAALIRTHHITSRKKVATLRAAAKEIGCAALLRSGATPGVMYVESPEANNVQKWVDTVHGLRYKDYQLVSPTAVVPERAITEATFDFEEVETVKAFGAKMQEKGIVNWWRKAMGYIPE